MMISTRTLDQAKANENIVDLKLNLLGINTVGKVRKNEEEYEIEDSVYGWVTINLANDTINHIV